MVAFQIDKLRVYYSHFTWHMRASRGVCVGGEGGGSPEKITNLKYFSNTNPDSLKITKLPSQHSMFSQHRPASERPFKSGASRGDIVSLLVFGSSIPSSTKKKKKTLSELYPSDKTFWIRAWFRIKFSGVAVSNIDKLRICSRHITPILHGGFMLIPCFVVYFIVSVLGT